MCVCLSHSARRERLPRLETTQGWLEWTMGSVAPGRIRLEQWNALTEPGTGLPTGINIIVAAAAEFRVARGPVDWGAWLLRLYGRGRFQEPSAANVN